MCWSSHKLVFPVIASLQKVKQWKTDKVTRTPNNENVAKVEIKMKKVLKQKERRKHIFILFTPLYLIINREKCIENPCMQ